VATGCKSPQAREALEKRHLAHDALQDDNELLAEIGNWKLKIEILDNKMARNSSRLGGDLFLMK
jgi:hypothetical protein